MTRVQAGADQGSKRGGHQGTRRWHLAAALALFGLPCAAAAQPTQASGDVFDSFFRFTESAHKVVFQEHPGETVDPFTGTLRIVQEDLSLPGKAGLDLRVVRTYSSKIWGRADLLDMEPLLAEKEHSVLGYGWSLHMGRLRSPNAIPPTLGCGGEYPVYEAPDGSARVFYPLPGASGNRYFQSKDYWRLDRDCFGGGRGACIWSTSGIRYELPAPENQFFIGTTLVWPVARIVDPHGNRIAISYQPQTGAVERVTDSYDRIVDFNYVAGSDGLRLDTLVASGRIYQYFYSTDDTWAGARRFLVEVKPPDGASYLYDYGNTLPVEQNRHALVNITYPWGGSTSYGYEPRAFYTGREKIPFSVVTSRVVWDGVNTAFWYYDYSSPGHACGDLVLDPTNTCSIDPATGQQTNMHVTTITRPDGKVDTYTIWGFGFVADEATMATKRLTFAAGLIAERATADRAEVEQFKWGFHPDPIANTPFAAPAYSENCGPHVVWDDRVWAPLMKGRHLVRDGAAFQTEYADFDAYGQARLVTETGLVGYISTPLPPQVRTTRLAYSYATAANIVHGKPTRQLVEEGGDQVETTWSYAGPALAKQSEIRNGIATTFGYHPTGDLAEVRNALGQVLRLDAYQYGVATSIDFNGAFQVTREPSWEGWVLGETDGRGHRTSYGYDLIGRPTLVTPPGVADPTIYTYALDGSAVTMSRGSYSKTASLDGLGRTYATLDSEGIRTTTYYDAMGQVGFQSFAFDGLTGEVGEAFERDGLGRVIRTTSGARIDGTSTCGADGACSVWTEHVANCERVFVERTPTLIQETDRCFTSFGDPGERRLRQVQEANGSLWEYVHDAAGKLTSVKAPLAMGDRGYQYDGNRYLRAEQTGESGTVTYSRNAVGQMTSRTDARQVTAQFVYGDALSRLTQVIYGTADDVTQGHDAANNLAHLSSANGGAYAYEYDEQNRPTTQTWAMGQQVYTTRYHYDAAGCLDSMTYPTGSVVALTCDTANRTTGVQTGTAVLASMVSYHPSGQVASASYGNGVTTGTSYDARGRPRTTVAPGVIDLHYEYDGADNVTSFEDRAVPGSLRTMGYDLLDRLTTTVSAGRWGTKTYGYDALGNRLWKSGAQTTTYTYDERNRLSVAKGTELLPQMRLTWNEAGRLVATSDGATYRYDGHGRRVEKTDADGTTVYHHDAAGRVIAETRPDGSTLREYFYLGNRLLAARGCVSGAAPGCTELEWYHTDALGSVLARTNGIGTVVTARLDYEPWGEQWSTSGTAGDRQYNGRVYDPGTGFHDYGARLYWPQIGRFISADTVHGNPARPMTLNRYSYVLNNPYKYVDPTGNYSVMPSIWGAEGGPLQWGAGWLAQKMADVSINERLPIEIRASAAVVGTLAGLLDAENAEKTGALMGVGGSIRMVGKPGALTPEQMANLGRFEKKLPAGAGDTAIHDLPAGGKAFQAEVPGRVPGSKAIYEKQVDSAGKTLQYTKTTVDPAGQVVHVKDKINGTVVKP